MGNFPGLTYSPTPGNIGDYYDFVKKAQDDTYLKIHTLRGPFGDNNDLNHVANLMQKVRCLRLDLRG